MGSKIAFFFLALLCSHLTLQALGDCVCDLTVDYCDINCCCDKDCSTNDVKGFSKCLPEGPVSGKVNFCDTKGELYRVNLDGNAFVDNLLCVAVMNNPRAETFYEDVSGGKVPKSQIDLEKTINIADFPLYKQGVPMFEEKASKLVTLSLPKADGNGLCNRKPIVGFLTNYQTDCINNSQSLCDDLSPKNYYIDFIVSSLNDLSLARINPTCYVNSVEDLNCSTLVANTGGVNCEGALVQAKYEFIYSSNTISSINVYFTLNDIPISSTTLQQSFEVLFSPLLPSGSAAKGMIRSGNPGYIHHSSLLWMDDSNNRIDFLNPGCANSPPLFDANSLSYCSHIIAINELDSSCAILNSALLSRFNVGSHPKYVGMFGNAVTTNSNEWTKVEESLNTSTGCNVITAIEVRFLYALQGAKLNPQSKIVGSLISYSTTDVSQLSVGDVIQLRTQYVFEQIAQEDPKPQKLKPPSFFPKLDDDLFYPFRYSSAANVTKISFVLSLCLFLCLFV